MPYKVNHLQEVAKKVALELNIKKTKVFLLYIRDNKHLTINNQHVERVYEFLYLGSMVDDNGGTERDFHERFNGARRLFKTALQHI